MVFPRGSQEFKNYVNKKNTRKNNNNNNNNRSRKREKHKNNNNPKVQKDAKSLKRQKTRVLFFNQVFWVFAPMCAVFGFSDFLIFGCSRPRVPCAVFDFSKFRNVFFFKLIFPNFVFLGSLADVCDFSGFRADVCLF